jgi:23S rRNA A1618 N6-methylase RlmF
VLHRKDPAASIALTRALLRADFGLEWDLPRGFLCPPVPQRANYVHWIEDLLAGPTKTATYPASAAWIPKSRPYSELYIVKILL